MRKYFPALSAICIKQSVNALCGQRDCHLKLRLMCNCKVIATPKVLFLSNNREAYILYRVHCFKNSTMLHISVKISNPLILMTKRKCVT